MKKMIVLFLICFVFVPMASAAPDNNLEKLLPILTREKIENEVSPKTTEELKKLFENFNDELPRIFVKNLPDDFPEKGSKKLYSKIITALILRENEKILNEKILFLLLKEKADNGEVWTKQEEAYFNYLVEKYDSTVLKTVPTKLEDLLMKIDEIPPSLAVAQAAFDTDFGKKNAQSPFGQTGWLDNKTYAPIKYNSLSEAVKEYVKEMNATPNYDDWRRLRSRNETRQITNASYHIAKGLRTYRPEDVEYVNKIRKFMKQNSFIFDMDNLNLKKN